MLSEILKVKPELDEPTAKRMEQNLNKRFQRIAKSFGGGLMKILTGGGIAGIAIGLIDKVLNPLKEIQEVIDKTLQKNDDLSTYAKQFQTTSGSLARLEAFGTATGLDPEGVRLLLGKFQQAVAQAAADPSKPSEVSQFVGRKDLAEAFFEFVQSVQILKKNNPDAANLVEQGVYGGKQILKASEFLNADFAMLAKAIGGPSAAQLTNSIEPGAALSDVNDILKARRGLNDIQSKSTLLSPNMIGTIDKSETQKLIRENDNLKNFQGLARSQLAGDKSAAQLEKAFGKIAPLLAPALEALPGILDKIITMGSALEGSRALRGMTPGAGKDK